MAEVNAELRKMREAWNTAKAEVKDLSGLSIPDGIYDVKVVSADLGYSKNGRFQAHFEYLITDGDYEGKSIHAYEGLETSTNIAYFLNKISRFGYDINSLTPDDLPEVLENIESDQRELTLTVVTKNGYQNKYIKDVYGEPSGGAKDVSEDESDNDPFDDDDGDDEKMLALGMSVSYTYRKKNYIGKVVEIDEINQVAKVNPVGTATLHVVKIDALNVINQEKD